MGCAYGNWLRAGRVMESRSPQSDPRKNHKNNRRESSNGGRSSNSMMRPDGGEILNQQGENNDGGMESEMRRSTSQSGVIVLFQEGSSAGMKGGVAVEKSVGDGKDLRTDLINREMGIIGDGAGKRRWRDFIGGRGDEEAIGRSRGEDKEIGGGMEEVQALGVEETSVLIVEPSRSGGDAHVTTMDWQRARGYGRELKERSLGTADQG